MVDFVMYSMFSHANLPYRTGGMKINVNVNTFSFKYKIKDEARNCIMPSVISIIRTFHMGAIQLYH
jgi:hypothetical protein